MKKALVFILMFLLGSVLFLSHVGEAAPPPGEEPPAVAVKVLETTRGFTVLSIRQIGSGNEAAWSKTLEFPGTVVQAKATWHERVGRGSVTDITASGNTVRVSGKVQYDLFFSAVLDVTVTGAYLSVEADVNGDGAVTIQDLVFIAARFGQTGKHAADVNKDGIVNIQDLVLVAGALRGAARAPAARSQSLKMLTAAEVQQWLIQAQQLVSTGVPSQRGIAVLEELLAALTPKKSALLPNYPNPFNPETWIPYHLAEPAAVTLCIYSADGKLVRTLALGHQPAGIYQSRSRAAYWDGRNAVGERVASGVYFYTLTAGDFAATGKMLIRK